MANNRGKKLDKRGFGPRLKLKYLPNYSTKLAEVWYSIQFKICESQIIESWREYKNSHNLDLTNQQCLGGLGAGFK